MAKTDNLERATDTRKRGRGRPRGARNKISKAQIAAALATGDLMPLDYLLSIMRNEDFPLPVRFEAAKAAAPFCHAKLASIQHGGSLGSAQDDWVRTMSQSIA